MAEKAEFSALELINEIKSEPQEFSKKSSDYWNMLTHIIIESQNIRYQKNISQKELADRMGTTQSVISRFENLGRTPNYDFIVRLAHALDCDAKIFLDGNYVVQVPQDLRNKLDKIIADKKTSIEAYLTNCIRDNISDDYISVWKDELTSKKTSICYGQKDFSEPEQSAEITDDSTAA